MDYRDADLIVQTSELALMNVVSLANTGALDLSPRFQRRNRWERDRQSKLIESFAMNAPVPPVYLAEESRGSFAVIDGKQRLTAIVQFLNNEFRLTDLSFRKDLSGRSALELPPQIQSTLAMRPLRVVTVMRQTADWVKHEVFMRLNTGGQALNAQEIRNVAFAGPLNDRLLTLALHPLLRDQLKIRDERSSAYADMSDVEYVLRFFAMAESWRNFGGSMREALDSFMMKNLDISPNQIERLVDRFMRSMEFAEALWGQYAFKRFDGQQWRDQMLGAVYDAQMVAIDLCDDMLLERAVVRRRDVVDATERLFADSNFEASVRTATNTSSKVQYRIEAVRHMLHEVAV